MPSKNVESPTASQKSVDLRFQLLFFGSVFLVPQR
jgi:hypothetical protein